MAVCVAGCCPNGNLTVAEGESCAGGYGVGGGFDVGFAVNGRFHVAAPECRRTAFVVGMGCVTQVWASMSRLRTRNSKTGEGSEGSTQTAWLPCCIIQM